NLVAPYTFPVLRYRPPCGPPWQRPTYDARQSPPNALADSVRTEPGRGVECWGKCVLLTCALVTSKPL
ncbi:hypothetical protein C7A09_28140, partial [Pseudomonas fluorescens]